MPSTTKTQPKIKATEGDGKVTKVVIEKGPIDRIAEDLRPLAKPIKNFKLDPENARLHPERNLQDIKDSLNVYGQRSVIVARKETMIVAKGNGTLEAMIQLGWTKAAISVQSMTDAEFAGYALADNRSGESSRWDFEVVARLQKLHANVPGMEVGWSADELEVLRMAQWQPPAISDEEFGENGKPKPIAFTAEQRVVIDRAILELRAALNDDDLEESQCIEAICTEWLRALEERDASIRDRD